jgi:hypothetical protein
LITTKSSNTQSTNKKVDQKKKVIFLSLISCNNN